MSTHAVLGVQFPDGKISGCYIHYDGDSMRPRIEAFLSKKTTTCLAMSISEAQAVGGMRSFPVEKHDDLLNDDERYDIDETNFYTGDHFGTHYFYLVDYETGEIKKRSN